MNLTKPFHEKSLSTQEKLIALHYTRVWDEDADDIARNSTGITPRVFLYTLPIMRISDGYLERHGEAVAPADIARKMGVTTREVGDALRELNKKLKIFGRDGRGIYYSLRMAAHFRKKAKTSSTSDKKPQESPNFQNESSSEENFHETRSGNESSLSKVSSKLSQSNLSETELNYDLLTDEQDKKGGADAAPPRAADADGVALLKDCWNIPNVNIAAEVTTGFVAGLANQLGVADAATSFRKLCASHVKNDKPVAIWNVEAWFNNEGKRKAKQATAAAKAPNVATPPAQDELNEIVIDL